MDVAMIDVTGIDCQEGDNGDIRQRPARDRYCRTYWIRYLYEVLTGISNRVKRVYFRTDVNVY